METQVLVVGGGPVGLTLAIDLGRRGVRCTLIEKNASTAPYPKMDRSNARTMELYRRIGIADRVRALGYPSDIPMNIYLCTTSRRSRCWSIPRSKSGAGRSRK